MWLRRFLLFSCCFALQPSPANANFFSRILRYGQQDDSKNNQPAGATASSGSEAQVGSVITFEDGVLMAHLANGNRIPLVGLGVGNAPHGHVSALIAEAIQDDKRIRLLDTAHASNNEDLVAEGILVGAKRMTGTKPEIHVVTKVWYTHLGYKRTKHSIEESLKNLKPALDSDLVTVKLHLMLHWPRCYNDIEWMDCQQEEANLDPAVKSLGPDPNKNPENAWKESWKYLEDLYLSEKYPIESIGVSNFHLQDLEVMEKSARIRPHVLQVNLWSLLYDSMLVDYCHKKRIHIQVYNTMHGTVVNIDSAPRAFKYIQKVANELTSSIGLEVTPAQTILAWLIQHGVSVIPRTSKLGRLHENSAVALAAIPAFTDNQVETVAHAVEAYMSGDDMEQDIHVAVTFHAVNQDIMLYWMGAHQEDQGQDEVRVSVIRKGESFQETTYPGHVFRTYNAYNKDEYVEHQIDANFGDHKHIHVEL